MENSKKEIIITKDMSKSQVDSIAGVLHKDHITLSLSHLEYTKDGKIGKIAGHVSSRSKKQAFASDRFEKLEITYEGEDVNIMIYSK